MGGFHVLISWMLSWGCIGLRGWFRHYDVWGSTACQCWSVLLVSSEAGEQLIAAQPLSSLGGLCARGSGHWSLHWSFWQWTGQPPAYLTRMGGGRVIDNWPGSSFIGVSLHLSKWPCSGRQDSMLQNTACHSSDGLDWSVQLLTSPSQTTGHYPAPVSDGFLAIDGFLSS